MLPGVLSLLSNFQGLATGVFFASRPAGPNTSGGDPDGKVRSVGATPGHS